MRLSALSDCPKTRPVNCKLQLIAPEDGAWMVETNQSLRFVFEGAFRGRINEDFALRDESIFVGEMEESDWLKSVRAEHVAEFGAQFAAVLENVKQYIVFGEDMTVSVLARAVKAVEV